MVNAILTTFVVVLLAYVYFQYVANTGAGESGFSTKLQESYDYIVGKGKKQMEKYLFCFLFVAD